MCSWLPELLPFTGNWEEYVKVIYDIFCNDFIKSRPIFRDKLIYIGEGRLLNGKELTFWHIISEGRTEEEKLPDLRRCERIRWPRQIIDHCTDPRIKIWENERQGSQGRGMQKRLCLWLEDADYLVVLSDRKRFYLLCTAYPIYGRRRREHLKKEYNAYQEAGAVRLNK